MRLKELGFKKIGGRPFAAVEALEYILKKKKDLKLKNIKLKRRGNVIYISKEISDYIPKKLAKRFTHYNPKSPIQIFFK